MDYDKLIKEILTSGDKTFETEHGLGREVYLVNNLAIKIPRNNSSDVRSGVSQSRIEYTIYNETKSKMLCPILYYNNGIIVMKRVESNPNELLQLIPNDTTFRELIFKEYGQELITLANTYNLNMIDLTNIMNWGYDKELNEFVCIDYGLQNNLNRMDLF